MTNQNQNIHKQHIAVDKKMRSLAKNQQPLVLWFTGISGAGKSTIANLVEIKLHAAGRHTYLLDGDNLRHGLNQDLSFTDTDRAENVRRVSEIARLMVDAGLITLTALISPFRSERQMARDLMSDSEFIEIFVDTPLDIAERHDPKGLYKKARRGEIKDFTGIDSPYEAPDNPDIHLMTSIMSSEEAADTIIAHLIERSLIN